MMSPALPGLVPVPAPAATQNQVEDERLIILAPLQLTPLSHWTTVSYFYSIHLTISSISFLLPPFISWGILNLFASMHAFPQMVHLNDLRSAMMASCLVALQ